MFYMLLVVFFGGGNKIVTVVYVYFANVEKKSESLFFAHYTLTIFNLWCCHMLIR